MPRQGRRGVMIDGLILPTKIRKRECSSSPCSSSKIRNYRLNKRAILVRKNRAGLGASRSSTPVPTWRTTPSRGTVDSPNYSLSGKSTQPVSARRLAATLWEINETPSLKFSETNLELTKQHQRKNGSKIKREKMQSVRGLHSGSGSLPPHLSDPSRSPTISEIMERTGTVSGTRSRSQRLSSAGNGVFDTISTASFMEIETRSRATHTSSGSVNGSRYRLKNISNALTTSKELLKIINLMWAHADQPASSMSLISALHSELESARLQVNYLIQEQRSNKNEINSLMKCFAEEKATWKNIEHQAIEAAIGSIAGELEMERKLRRRLESLNKKLGKELAEMKSSFLKTVKELENEKRAREITEQVCDELARNIDEDRADVERLKRDSAKVHEDIENEREMLELADKLLEERVGIKPSEAKHQSVDKKSAFNKLRKQLEVFLGTKRSENTVDRATHLSKSNVISHQTVQEEDGEVEDAIYIKEDSAESGIHSIQLNANNKNKSYKWAYPSAVSGESGKLPVGEEIKARNSDSRPVSRKSTVLERTMSDRVEWGTQGGNNQMSCDGLNRDRLHELEKGGHRRSHFDVSRRHKITNGLKEREQSWPLRDPFSTVQDRSSLTKSRTGDV